MFTTLGIHNPMLKYSKSSRAIFLSRTWPFIIQSYVGPILSISEISKGLVKKCGVKRVHNKVSTDGRTDGQTDGRTDGQTDRQTTDTKVM